MQSIVAMDDIEGYSSLSHAFYRTLCKWKRNLVPFLSILKSFSHMSQEEVSLDSRVFRKVFSSTQQVLRLFFKKQPSEILI